MRVLVSATSGFGHVAPLLPLARAFRDRGDAVAFATSGRWKEHVDDERLAFFDVGLDPAAAVRLTAERNAWVRDLPVAERRPHAFTGKFAHVEGPVRLPQLAAAADQWHPDLMVFESGDLAAPLVATQRGITAVHHGFGRPVPEKAFRVAATTTDSWWRAAALEPDEYGGVFRGPYVDLCPPSLDGWQVPASRVLRIRPATARERRPRSRPLVYATLGTIFNRPEMFRPVLDGLGGVDCDVLVTIGTDNDLAAFGEIPPNVRVERFVPQDEVLCEAAAAVMHGGSGSMFGALAHAVPMLLLPQAADQFDNAEASERAGAAIRLIGDQVSPAAVDAAVRQLLADDSFRAGAARLAEEIAAMPSPDEVAAQLS